MAIYFLTKIYDKKEVGDILERIGFERNKNYSSYGLGGEIFKINFTDSEEGIYQIQGDGPEDIWEKGKQSMYYPILNGLVRILNPEKIIDDCYKDIFPELIRD